MLSNIIVARLLGQVAFGEYAIVLNTLLTLSAVAQSAIGFTVAKYVAEFRNTDKERSGRVLGVCIIITTVLALLAALLLLAGSAPLATYALNDPHIAPVLMLGTVFLVFSALNGYQLGALAGLEGFGKLARAGILSGILAVVCISLGALWFGVFGAVGGLGLSALLRFGIHQYLLDRELEDQAIRVRYRGSIQREMPIVTGFALPTALASYYTIPMLWIANAVLVAQPEGYAQMALYSAATTLKTVVLFMPQSINLVSLSVLNNILGDASERGARKVFLINTAVISLATVVFAAGLYLISPVLLSFFGPSFVVGQEVVNFLIGATVFEGVGMVLLQRLQSQARGWTILCAVNVPRELIFVSVAIWKIPTDGATGIALAYLVAWIFACFTIAFLTFISFRRN